MQVLDQQDFISQLRKGEQGEALIARWMLARGWDILPVYEKEGVDLKGPRFFTAQKKFIAPDILAFKGSAIRWCEAKHKSVFSWHRLTSKWTTGIDAYQWRDYLQLSQRYPFEFWLLFLHKQSYTPEHDHISPVGLYGNTIQELAKKINHRSDKWGKSGMIYWAKDSLIKLATLGEIHKSRNGAML